MIKMISISPLCFVFPSRETKISHFTQKKVRLKDQHTHFFCFSHFLPEHTRAAAQLMLAVIVFHGLVAAYCFHFS